MKRIRLIDNNFGIRCSKCGQLIEWGSKYGWKSENDKAIIGICFVDESGDPIEAFDLCPECIGKLYSKMIY